MAKFIVQNNSTSYEITESKLVELLLKASLDKNKEEERKGTKEILASFGTIFNTKMLFSYSIGALMEMTFMLGFYYARFIEKNKVIIKEDNNGN